MTSRFSQNFDRDYFFRMAMDALINLVFPQAGMESMLVEHRVPHLATHKIPFAQCNYWKHPSYTVIEQYYQSLDVFVYLGEVRCETDLTLQLHCSTAQIYWCYPLAGQHTLSIQQRQKTLTLRTHAKSYRAVYLPAGKHAVFFKKDVHYLLFYFVVRKEQLLRFENNGLQFIRNLLVKLKTDDPGFACTIPLALNTTPLVYVYRIFRISRLDQTGQDQLRLEMQLSPLILRLLISARQSHEEETTVGQKTTAKLEELRQLVRTYIGEGIAFTIQELAEHAQLNAHYLNQLHKQHYQESMQHFISRSRMEEAYRLLSEEHLPPTEVAFSLLYYDLTAFSKAFKKTYGLTPSGLYRQKPKP